MPRENSTSLFFNALYEKQPGLIGMDFVRLALERSQTAEEALWVIIRLLETYGQGGNCGFRHAFYYHNSFLIADSREAWVLETAGRHWVAERVRGIRTISNALSIRGRGELASEDVVRFAIDQGWCKRADDFDFATCYSDWLYTTFADGRRRQACSTEMLLKASGKVSLSGTMAALRSHNVPRGHPWRPDQGLTGADICMHAGFGPVRRSQSVGSMVVHLHPERFTFWVTATSAPCTSIFKPLWLDAGLPNLGPQPTGTYDPQSLFWQHEVLHREILRDYPVRIALLKDERDALEHAFVEGVEALRGAPEGTRFQYSQDCFARAAEAEKRWLEKVRSQPLSSRPQRLYAQYWRRLNRVNGIPVDMP